MEAIQTEKQIEIINSREIRTRLDISEPTLIRWRQKGKIPYLAIGSVIRYNWFDAVEALTVKKGVC